MSFHIPRRSQGGCLTCKQRKKKCDETKPVCRRCTKGDFHCLGYDSLGALELTNSALDAAGELDHMKILTHSASPNPTDDPFLAALDDLVNIPLPGYAGIAQEAQTTMALQKTTSPSINIPGPFQLQLETFSVDQVLPLILSQYTAITQHVLFKPPSTPLTNGLLWRANNSQITRWSMYLGARISRDISNGSNGQRYMNWIARLCQQIMRSSTKAGLALDELDMHLAGLRDVTTWAYIISGTSTGYSLFRSNASLFLRLAALCPKLWSDDAAISISEAVQTRQYEIKDFVFHDTVTALVLGTPPLVRYDTTPSWAAETQHSHLQWVYGFPTGLIVLLAKINSWRASRLMGQVTPDPNHNNWREIEERLRNWAPAIDYTDEACNDIGRLAIQESLRQAALVYLYMGMCEVNSADPRVESGVRQIIQLASTIGPNNPLRLHLFLPCLIAGAAARQEKYRAIVRSKLENFRGAISIFLRGPDFIPVLDHLWHGVASGGSPTTWEDYIQSRRAALPIEA